MVTQTKDSWRVQTMKIDTMKIDTSTLNKGECTCFGHICLLLKAGELD